MGLIFSAQLRCDLCGHRATATVEMPWQENSILGFVPLRARQLVDPVQGDWILGSNTFCSRGCADRYAELQAAEYAAQVRVVQGALDA